MPSDVPPVLSLDIGLSGPQAITASSALTLAGSLSIYLGAITVDNTATVTISGSIGLDQLSPTILTKTGAGQLFVTGNDNASAGLIDGTTYFNGTLSGDGNDVTLTPVNPNQPPRFAVGAGAGGGPQVNVYAIANGFSPLSNRAILLRSFLAYGEAFRGGVRVASADFTGDGVVDVVTAPGPGGGPHVRVWDGATFALVREFMAYDTAFTGGVFVAAGDVNDDGTPDIITGAGPGGGPNVRTFDGKTGALQYSFMAYDPAFTGGVTVAAAKIFEANPAFVITGAGPGGGPHVKVFAANAPQLPLQSFFAFDSAFRGGVTVAAGDTDGDGVADIIVGAGPGGFPQVRSFSFFDGAIGVDFPAYNPAFRGGVTVAAVTVSSLATDIVTGAGPGGGPHVIARSRLDFFAFDPAFLGGVFVG
jgi:hypothetical protein